MTTNAKRQAAYKERMRKAGYQQVTLWIQPERKEILRDFAEVLRETPTSKHKNMVNNLGCFHESFDTEWIDENL